jgi:hypothetical protein
MIDQTLVLLLASGEEGCDCKCFDPECKVELLLSFPAACWQHANQIIQKQTNVNLEMEIDKRGVNVLRGSFLKGYQSQIPQSIRLLRLKIRCSL